MNDFDAQWDNLDINDLDIDVVDTDEVTTADKKADRIITQKDYEQNIDYDYDKFLDYDNPEGDQVATNETKWRKLISNYEKNFKKVFATKADEFNYQMIATKDKYQTAKQKNSPMTKFFSAKLNELNAKRQELVDWAKGNITELNYLKGRASGFITSENAGYYNNNPEAVRAELATGNYEYQPTHIK